MVLTLGTVSILVITETRLLQGCHKVVIPYKKKKKKKKIACCRPAAY